tara:strand:+ start:894 stop:1100 length:207 start_codon:yes stop_codon:yes gene_type:complete
MIRIECIKGIQLDGGSFPIMQGEVFNLINEEDMIFESVVGESISPGFEVEFSNEQLANNFKVIKFNLA